MQLMFFDYNVVLTRSSYLTSFQDHLIKHTEEVIRFLCVACNLPFDTRELLAVHVQLIHDRMPCSLENHITNETTHSSFTVSYCTLVCCFPSRRVSFVRIKIRVN